MIVNTVPSHIWKHEVVLAAIRAGVDAEWIKERFAARMVIWWNAGETIEGAVEMILFTWKQEPIETRGARELESLRNISRRAAKLGDRTNWDWTRGLVPTSAPHLKLVRR